MVFHTSIVNWSGANIYPEYMCILLYVKLIWCNSIPYIYGQLEGYICLQYMCIVLYVKHIWCNGIPYIYGQLEWGVHVSWVCAFCYMWNLLGVMVFHRSMVNERRGPWYMCILLYVKPLWCSSIWYIYGQMEGVNLPEVYVHCVIC